MRETTDLFLIDGKPVLIPDGNLGLTLQDMESADSGLDESAVLHRFLARHGVGKWTFSYEQMTQAEYAYMESLFAGKGEFLFTRPDAKDGTPIATKCYRSKHQIVWRNAAAGQFRNYQFDIIEC